MFIGKVTSCNQQKQKVHGNKVVIKTYQNNLISFDHRTHEIGSPTKTSTSAFFNPEIHGSHGNHGMPWRNSRRCFLCTWCTWRRRWKTWPVPEMDPFSRWSNTWSKLLGIEEIPMDVCLVVWNMFYFPIYWEESSQLTNISEGLKSPTSLWHGRYGLFNMLCCWVMAGQTHGRIWTGEAGRTTEHSHCRKSADDFSFWAKSSKQPNFGDVQFEEPKK